MRRSRVTGGTARSMAVARRSAGSLWNSPGSRALCGVAADVGSVGQLAQIFQPSPDISIEGYPPSLRQHGSLPQDHVGYRPSRAKTRRHHVARRLGHLFRPGQIPDQYVRVEEDHSAVSHSSPIGLVRSPASISATVTRTRWRSTQTSPFCSWARTLRGRTCRWWTTEPAESRLA